MRLYSTLLRPILFQLDAERAHHSTIEACHWLEAFPGVTGLARILLEADEPCLQTEAAGLRFAHPIGLAAGWDKSGRALRMIDSIGFGFAEIGSISARPSRGNPCPRLFRLPADQAIIVNYGLPNDGAEVVAARLAAHRPRHPLGVNIVKTNDGPSAPPCSEDDILADYHRSASLLHRHASYLALNLSCPNVVGGNDFFAQPGSITRLLSQLTPLQITCPVFLKIAPHDDPAEHERVLTECDPFPFVRGFCFNLPTGKPDTLQFTTPREAFAHQPGAVAGRPVEHHINRCIAGLYQRIDHRREQLIIGAGGIFTAADAYKKIRLGATLLQLYTALIYRGPGVVKQIAHGLVKLLERDGYTHISQAIGTARIQDMDQS